MIDEIVRKIYEEDQEAQEREMMKKVRRSDSSTQRYAFMFYLFLIKTI